MQIAKQILNTVIWFFIFLIFVRAAFMWFPTTRRRYRNAGRMIDLLTDPFLRPFQRILPARKTAGLDLSPIFSVLILQVIRQALVPLLPLLPLLPMILSHYKR